MHLRIENISKPVSDPDLIPVRVAHDVHECSIGRQLSERVLLASPNPKYRDLAETCVPTTLQSRGEHAYNYIADLEAQCLVVFEIGRVDSRRVAYISLVSECKPWDSFFVDGYRTPHFVRSDAISSWDRFCSSYSTCAPTELRMYFIILPTVMPICL